jgi:DNA-binding transcriptional ArsR family regulator
LTPECVSNSLRIVHARVADGWAALGDPTRRGILAQLIEQPRSVTALAQGLLISRPAVSQHLRILKDADLVHVRVLGREHIYAAKSDGLARLRTELDAFWSQALANFKIITEEENDKKIEDLQ